MIKIKFFGAISYTTAMLVENMKKAAKERHLKVDIEAAPTALFPEYVEKATDVALLGPHAEFMLYDLIDIASPHNTALAVLPAQHYENMDGHKALDLALSFID